MGTDGKYGKVTTEKGDFGKDEPLFVLRAKDAAAGPTLEMYASISAAMGSPGQHVEEVRKARQRFLRWQENNGARVPGQRYAEPDNGTRPQPAGEGEPEDGSLPPREEVEAGAVHAAEDGGQAGDSLGVERRDA